MTVHSDIHNLHRKHVDVLRAAARGAVVRKGARDMWAGRGVTASVTELVFRGLLERPDGSERWQPTPDGLIFLKSAP